MPGDVGMGPEREIVGNKETPWYRMSLPMCVKMKQCLSHCESARNTDGQKHLNTVLLQQEQNFEEPSRPTLRYSEAADPANFCVFSSLTTERPDETSLANQINMKHSTPYLTIGGFAAIDEAGAAGYGVR